MRAKHLISFSVWGNNPGYVRGAVENAKLQPIIYPGWKCRFYCDSKVPADSVKELMDLGSEVVMKPDSVDFSGLYWRFEPMFDDPTIDRFIVRDTDSRLNVREADAVQEWIESDLPFHIMRDNPAHNIEIMGGMWGSKAGIIPEFYQLYRQWMFDLKPDMQNPRGKFHGSDQAFLCQMIWPYIMACHIAHDERHSYTGHEKPFRVELNRDGYVGMIWSEKDQDRVEALV